MIVVSVMIRSLVGSGFQPGTALSVGTELAILTTSFLAIVAALVGTGQLGIPTAICAGFCLLLFMIHALAA